MVRYVAQKKHCIKDWKDCTFIAYKKLHTALSCDPTIVLAWESSWCFITWLSKWFFHTLRRLTNDRFLVFESLIAAPSVAYIPSPTCKLCWSSHSGYPGNHEGKAYRRYLWSVIFFYIIYITCLFSATGAGISVQAGIPDFRSSDGLFKSIKRDNPRETMSSGKELFDASVFNVSKLGPYE